MIEILTIAFKSRSGEIIYRCDHFDQGAFTMPGSCDPIRVVDFFKSRSDVGLGVPVGVVGNAIGEGFGPGRRGKKNEPSDQSAK